MRPGFDEHVLLAPNLHVFPRRFKRITASLTYQEYLSEDTASAFVLLSRLLRRGTRRYPSVRAIERVLANLYGATLSIAVRKVADRQIGVLTITWPVARHVSADEHLVTRVLMLMCELFTSPALVSGRFPDQAVVEERRAQLERISSLVNNKAVYALRRCEEVMCTGEPHGINEFGEARRLASLDGVSLATYHSRLITKSPLNVFIVGEVVPDDLFPVLEQSLRHPQQVRQFPPVVLKRARSTPQYVEETKPMRHAWLVLGFRTDLHFDDPKHSALEIYNGMLGGFVNSRLFRNLREKARLAYSTFSRYVEGKGLILAIAGIDPNYRKEAEAVILRQVEDLRLGRFDDEELEVARHFMIDRIYSDLDRSIAFVQRAIERTVFVRKQTLGETIQDYLTVTWDDVHNVANRVELDTIYFLRGDK